MPHRALTLTLLLFTLPAVLPAAGIPVVGRVLGPDGDPRTKAEVHLEPILSTYERAVLRLQGKPGPEPVATARPDDTGTFELAAPEAGMWKVVVTSPGMLPVEIRLLPLVAAEALPAVKLTPAAHLKVRLVDAEGKPRPGRIGATSLGARGFWRPRLRLAAAGEDGVAEVPLGRGEKIQLEVLADGYPLAVFEVVDESSVTIDLKAGVAGTVRVTDQQKRPLAGAVAFQGSALVPLGLSDDDGLLPLVLQAEKRPAVRISSADRWNGSFDVDFGGKGGKRKDLRLDPPATIQGVVLDLQHREPVPGALVWMVRGEVAVTDEQGRYALDDGVYKSRSVRAAKAGYRSGYGEIREAGEAAAIALTPAAGLSGRVVDHQGAPLAGVAIEIGLLPQGGRFSSAAQRGWSGG